MADRIASGVVDKKKKTDGMTSRHGSDVGEAPVLYTLKIFHRERVAVTCE